MDDLTIMDLELLFKKLDELLVVLCASNENDLFDNLSNFDAVYFELVSRKLKHPYCEQLESANSSKEKVLERFENEIDKRIQENISASENADIGTVEGKKLFFELHAQWSDLSNLQSNLLHYRISSTRRMFDITSKSFQELKDSGVLDALRRGEFSTEIVDE